MAYPIDTVAQSAALDAMLGAAASSSMPTSFEVALFTDHPVLGGMELTSTGGYARVTVANNGTVFPAAVSGLKTSTTVSFGSSSDAWSDTAPYAVLIDAADSTTQWFAVLLDDEVTVDAAGTSVSVELKIFWNTEAL